MKTKLRQVFITKKNILASTAIVLMVSGSNLANAAFNFSELSESTQSEYTFITIDPQGSTYTDANGNSDSGEIAGDYNDANGITHGFILNNKQYKTVDIPGKYETSINGISSNNRYVGTYWNNPVGTNSPVSYAFFQDKDELITLFQLGWSESQGGNLNEQGMVVGGYRELTTINGKVINLRHAFLWNNGIYATIDPKGCATLGPVAFGINESVQIVGSYVDEGCANRHGFLRSQNGTYTQLDVPGASFTVAEGINNSGDIAGLYVDTLGVFHGFILSKGVYKTIDVPQSMETTIFSINDEGEIVGNYTDTSGFVHGYIGKPKR